MISTVSEGKGGSEDVTVDKQETDALSKAEEVGAECRKSFYYLFSGRSAAEFARRNSVHFKLILKQDLLSVNSLYGNDRPAWWYEKSGYSKGQLLELEVGKLSHFFPAVYQFLTLQ